MNPHAGSKWYCKACNLWVANHVANIARHESSEVHKRSIERKIREADSQKKEDSRRDKVARKEVEKITRMAEASMGSGTIARHADHVVFGLDPSVVGPQKSSSWLTCRSENGRLYFVNKITGISQWENPEDPESGSKPDVNPEVRSIPLPRPKSALPPPRPKSSATTKRLNEDAKLGDQSLLASAFKGPMQEEMVSRKSDATTGFGEWEEVEENHVGVGESLKGDESVLERIDKSIKFMKRFEFTGDDDGDLSSFRRPVTKKIKRRSVEED